MKKAKYGKMRQVTAVNAVNGSKTEGFLLPWFSPIIYHIAAFPATAQEERRDASPLSLVLLLLHVPVQECHDLASRAGVVRTERVRAGAVCNLRVVVHCPQHSISNRAYVLENGRITMSGDASTLLHDDKVRKAYLGA